MGVDVITMGNHTWDNKDIFDFIDDADYLIRPANFSSEAPGKGMVQISKKMVSHYRLLIYMVEYFYRHMRIHLPWRMTWLKKRVRRHRLYLWISMRKRQVKKNCTWLAFRW